MYSVASIKTPEFGYCACTVPVELDLTVGAFCVCEVEHIHEIGQVYELSSQSTPPDSNQCAGTVLRVATADDQTRNAANREHAAQALSAFRELLAGEQAPARAIRARFSLRRERLAIWYACDHPLDLRQVVGHIQRQFSTKVETRQIDCRETAAILGGCGVCGRPLCCNSWMRKPPNVHLNMARMQDFSTVPSAVNGMCSRIKCCLEHEYEQYAENVASMPPVGVIVSWDDGEGLVVAREILARKVTVRHGNRFIVKNVAELKPGRGTTPPTTGRHEEYQASHEEDTVD